MSDLVFLDLFWNELKTNNKIKSSKAQSTQFVNDVLISLNLEHNNIKTVPETIGEFTNLLVLDLS